MSDFEVCPIGTQARLAQVEAERDALQKSVEEWEAKELTWFASPEAAKRLDGYRELAEQANKAAAERDALLAACAAYSEWADKTVCTDPELRAIRQQMRSAIALVKKGGGNG